METMKKNKIMIIDDEPDFLLIVKLNLEKTGNYEILTLSDAREIIAQLHSFKPDVILLDLLMPQIGGIEACEMINKDSLGRNIPIIILSALEKKSDKLMAYKAGIVDYVIKPVEINELIAKIEKALKFKQ
ncbi:MAG: hypothetical protein A2Z72_01465 [Omnitrophica bacterium RBG_13_46_9]|nr:MAG: hypothetical protein A2Z72_01465 [Omnitrophica bacterium RBG_13_46_9]